MRYKKLIENSLWLLVIRVLERFHFYVLFMLVRCTEVRFSVECAFVG